ncbi:MAG: hypothetical protein WC755_01915 [Candidatus Woesearchaeota archaeon]
MNGLYDFEYSKELDEELKTILEEYRAGQISTRHMLELVDMACKEHLDSRMLGSIEQYAKNRDSEK